MEIKKEIKEELIVDLGIVKKESQEFELDFKDQNEPVATSSKKGNPTIKKENAKEFNCPKCFKSFRAKNHLTNHFKSHIHDDDDHDCETCGRSFPTRKQLMWHLTSHSKKVYDCKECGKPYKTRRFAKVHYLTVHKGLSEFEATGKRFTCETCGKEYSTRSPFDKHLTTHGPRKYKCTLCPKAYRNTTRLRWHMDIHSTERKFKCTTCGATFKRQCGLHRHEMTHQDTRIPCKICKKKIRQDSMWGHIKIHAENRNEFECEKCGQKFKTKQGIAHHIMKIHLRMSGYEITGKRFTCEHCGKELYETNKFNTHLRSHSTVKPFNCPLCHKAFKHKQSMNEHLVKCREKNQKPIKTEEDSSESSEDEEETSSSEPLKIKIEKVDEDAVSESYFELESSIKLEEYLIDE